MGSLKADQLGNGHYDKKGGLYLGLYIETFKEKNVFFIRSKFYKYSTVFFSSILNITTTRKSKIEPLLRILLL